MAIAPPPELHSLISRRIRRHARKAMRIHGLYRRLLRRKQRMLMDAVQDLGA